MSTYIDVASLADIPTGAAVQVEIHGLHIGIYNVDGTLYAMDDLCSHDHAWLSEGVFNTITRTVRCPKHTSSFDVTTGRPKTLPAIRPVKTYATKIEEGRILLLLNS
jgi:3-phenylpropionate/trans-cinnamate dioxygenase ferredoxin subunit